MAWFGKNGFQEEGEIQEKENIQEKPVNIEIPSETLQKKKDLNKTLCFAAPSSPAPAPSSASQLFPEINLGDKVREERRWQHLFTDGTKLRDKYLETGRKWEPRNLPGMKTAHGEIPGKERDSGKKNGTQRERGK